MTKLGISIGPHYRVFKDKKDIRDLINFFVKEKIQIIELSFYDKKSYNLFYEAYLKSSAILNFIGKKRAQRIHLHLPKKDWELIGVDKILQDMNNLDKKIKIDKFVIHHKEYINFKKELSRFDNKIYVENGPLQHNISDFKGVERIVCDVNHFYHKGKFQQKKFLAFLGFGRCRIKEFHFAHANHGTFDNKNVLWLKNIYKKIKETSCLNEEVFIFEGTDKYAINVDTLKKTLSYNLFLIKKALCKQ